MKKRGMRAFYTAPLWKRVFAYIVDLFIVNLVIVLPFRSYLGRQLISDNNISISDLTILLFNNQNAFYSVLFVLIVISIPTILYWTLLEYFVNQSVGKILFKIKVISSDGDLKFSQALLRNITKVSILTIALDTLYLLKSGGIRYLEKHSKTRVVEI